jgi:FtsP/CotA-like multicopper oxidase with cupredoxin domain
LLLFFRKEDLVFLRAFIKEIYHMRAIACTALLFGLCLGSRAAWADADEYAGLAWQPNSTPTHPCGIGIPPRGNFARDRWVNARQPKIGLTVRQEGTTLCYVIDGIAEAPTIRVKQGATLTINLRNEITNPWALVSLLPSNMRDAPLGAVPKADGTLEVVPGRLHEVTGRTNLHVHGFSVPPTVPQDEVLMGCVDPARGDESCGRREMTYTYPIPVDMAPGLYWYHPHVHGEVQAQMLAGLSGAIVVEGPEDRAREAAGIEDRVFIVRQLKDSDAKSVSGGAALPPVAGAHVSDTQPQAALAIPGARIDTRHEMGCSDAAADEISLNGGPVVDGASADKDLAPLTIPAGATQLWRVVNAATDAVLDLALLDENGKPVPVRVVARDGAPVTDDSGKAMPLRPTTQAQMVPPAGRVEFLVDAPPLGKKLTFVSHAVDTGCAGDKVPERRLALLTSVDFPTDHDTPMVASAAAPAPDLYAGLLARKTDRARIVAFAEYPRPGAGDQNDFYIAERRPGVKLTPFDMDGAPTITLPAGAVEEWTVENWTNEIHAFHIHQVHFRVLAVNGHPEAEPRLLDTVLVPAASPAESDAPAPGSVTVKLYFPPSLAGDIPFHCHLVDHEDNGMMGVVRVVPAADATGTVRKVDASGIPGVRICRAVDPHS